MALILEELKRWVFGFKVLGNRFLEGFKKKDKMSHLPQVDRYIYIGMCLTRHFLAFFICLIRNQNHLIVYPLKVMLKGLQNPYYLPY
jgi:hypothetical protein